MAGEIVPVSTTSTLAGFMERYQAESIYKFNKMSRFKDAVWNVEANNAQTVQVPTLPAASPVSVNTEASGLTPAARSAAAVTLTMGTYAQTTILSDLSLKGGTGVADAALGMMMTDVVAGVDKLICSAISSLTDATVSDETTMTFAIFRAVKLQLNITGYWGTPVCLMTETAASNLFQDTTVRVSFPPEKAEEYFGSGYIGTLLGVDIFTGPDSWFVTQNTSYKRCGMFYKECGIVLGLHTPFVTVEAMRQPISEQLTVSSYAAAGVMSATGGVYFAVN